MYLVYSNHAKGRLKKRKILHIWVEETIKFSDITQHYNGEYHAI